MTTSERCEVYVIIDGDWVSDTRPFFKAISEASEIPLTRYEEVLADVISLNLDQQVSLNLLTFPRTRRFDFWYEFIASGSFLGAIVLFDVRDTWSWRSAKGAHGILEAYTDFPYIMAANNFQPDQWNIDDLRILMRLDKGTPLVPCDTSGVESVKRVLLALCEENLKYGTSSA
ncbi:MAG: hypothetical protein AAF787_06990 [Chloroflexota bacterium]